MSIMSKMDVIHPVKNIYVSGETVKVEFYDHHVAAFYPYRHGWGYQIEGLSGFSLKLADQDICIYHARLHRVGPQEDEHKIKLLADGYTQQQVAEYWESARSHIHNLFWQVDSNTDESDKSKWYEWRVTSEGWIDLDRLKEGRAELGVESDAN